MSETVQAEVVENQVTTQGDSAILPALAASLSRKDMGASVEIEVQRAVAQVHITVMAAKSCPRDEDAALAKILKACKSRALAERAVFSIKKGNERVEGPSIHLLKEIARLWGNMDYGWAEHVVTPEESEYEAWCWDMENNVRSTLRFKVKPIRYSNGAPLTKPNEIYENAAAIAARRVRSTIQSNVPAYVVEEAQEACKRTLSAAVERDLPTSKAKALNGFADRFKITQAQLEAHLGKSWAEVTGDDVAGLLQIYTSLKEGHAKPEEFFKDAPPAAKTTTPAAAKPAVKPADKPAEKPVEKPVEKPPVSKGKLFDVEG